MGKLRALAEENPSAVDFAFSHAAETGDLSQEGFVQILSEKVGGERADVEALVEATRSAYVAATDAAVAQVSNVEPQLVYDWLRDQQPGLAGEVIMEAQAGRFGAVKKATGVYLENLASIDPEAALSADLGPHAKPERVNGKVAVRMNGKVISWREAMRYRTNK